MKSKLLMPLALVVALLAVCGPMFAHHGSAAYVNTVVVLKDATVTKFVWANPHSFVMFDVKDDKGNIVHWAAETGSSSAVSLLGWSRNSLQPGDVVAVYTWAAKSGSPVGRLKQSRGPQASRAATYPYRLGRRCRASPETACARQET
jgi:Family of unknown function (DUF6152)